MTYLDQVPHAAENMLLHPGSSGFPSGPVAELLESVVHGGSASWLLTVESQSKWGLDRTA
jgi:hypothetical protein